MIAEIGKYAHKTIFHSSIYVIFQFVLFIQYTAEAYCISSNKLKIEMVKNE